MESTNEPVSQEPVVQEPAIHETPIRRRQPKPRGINPFLSTLGIAVLIATLFTAWTPNSIFTNNLSDQLRTLLTPQSAIQSGASTPLPQIRIGIVAGHMGNDSGAVCYDDNGEPDLTEADVNLSIANLVQRSLTERGFQVDLLNEFDTRLNGYRAAALVSIHNDSCDYINDEATGFKVAASLETRDVNRAQRLTACLTDRYQNLTGLFFHANSITPDMTQYHAFSEIDPNTITAIIETGFLYLDREILTKQTDVVAEGVTQGILCFVNNESVLPNPVNLPTILP